MSSHIFNSRILLLVCWFSTSWALFPDQFEMNSFLFNNPPRSFENDFFNPRVPLQNEDDFRFGTAAIENAPVSSPTAGGVLVSQNRKYLAKSPAHDKHFQSILRQQEAATIRDPGQAAIVASDQMELRRRPGIKYALQTSDDDIYEVESAPMMKSTPYRASNRRERYRKPRDMEEQEQQSERDVELPVSVSFQSNIDHSYEPKQHHQQKRDPVYEKYLEEGEPTEPNYSGKYSLRERRYPARSQSGTMHFSMGQSNQLSNDAEDRRNVTPYQKQSRTPNSHRAKHHQYNHSPYQNIQYTHVPTDGYQAATKPHYYKSSMNEYKNGQLLSSPGDNRQPGHDNSNKYDKNQMESSWLDMGAYSSGKGAFGWYSDVPVGGPHGQSA